MKRITFLCPCDITRPNRGTPIRIAAILSCLQTDPNLDIVIYQTQTKRIWQRLWDIRKLHPNIIFANTHYDFFTALACKLFLRCKIIIDIHGLAEEELFFYGQISKSKKFLLRTCYRLGFRAFDLLSCACNGIRQAYLPASLQHRSIVLWAGIHPQDFPEPAITSRSQPLCFGYIGNARGYQGFDIVLRICSRLAQENRSFSLRIVSSEQKNMEQAIYAQFPKTPEWIHTSYELSHEDAQRAMDTCDVLLLLRPRNPVTTFSFPAKLPEQLALGKTSIISSVSDIGDVLINGTDAYLVNPDHREEEAYVLLKGMIDGTVPLLNAQRIHIKALETFSWKSLCAPLLQRIHQL